MFVCTVTDSVGANILPPTHASLNEQRSSMGELLGVSPMVQCDTSSLSQKLSFPVSVSISFDGTVLSVTGPSGLETLATEPAEFAFSPPLAPPPVNAPPPSPPPPPSLPPPSLPPPAGFSIVSSALNDASGLTKTISGTTRTLGGAADVGLAYAQLQDGSALSATDAYSLTISFVYGASTADYDPRMGLADASTLFGVRLWDQGNMAEFEVARVPSSTFGFGTSYGQALDSYQGTSVSIARSNPETVTFAYSFPSGTGTGTLQLSTVNSNTPTTYTNVPRLDPTNDLYFFLISDDSPERYVIHSLTVGSSTITGAQWGA